MKKKLPPFFSGVATMALIGSLTISALAASGAVTFNTSALQLNGQQISAKGENYTLANGQSVPASISYTDEQGGATTYLPVRRLAELLGVEVGWDQTTGSVTVSGDIKAPATPTPDTTTPPDYSTWSKEDEAAYQEFKGMWDIGEKSSEPSDNFGTTASVVARYNGSMSEEKLIGWMKAQGELTMNKFAQRMMEELYENEGAFWLHFSIANESGIKGESPRKTFWTVAIFNTNANKQIIVDFSGVSD